MSHHNKEIYPEYNTIELHAEMAIHGLVTQSPSQMSDVFRFGWIAHKNNQSKGDLITALKDIIELDLSTREDCERVLAELQKEPS